MAGEYTSCLLSAQLPSIPQASRARSKTATGTLLLLAGSREGLVDQGGQKARSQVSRRREDSHPISQAPEFEEKLLDPDN